MAGVRMSYKPAKMLDSRNGAARGRMQGRVTSGHFSRRRFVSGAGAAFTAIVAPGLIRVAAAQSWRAGNPFSLGVASGAPRADGFVLWTRLGAEPLSSNPGTPGG